MFLFRSAIERKVQGMTMLGSWSVLGWSSSNSSSSTFVDKPGFSQSMTKKGVLKRLRILWYLEQRSGRREQVGGLEYWAVIGVKEAQRIKVWEDKWWPAGILGESHEGKRQCWHAFQMKYSLRLFQCCRGWGLRWTQGLRAHAERCTSVSGSKWDVGESSSVLSYTFLTWAKVRIALFPESSSWFGELIFFFWEETTGWRGFQPKCADNGLAVPRILPSSSIINVLCIKFEIPPVGKIWFLRKSSCTQIHFISIYFKSLNAGKWHLCC